MRSRIMIRAAVAAIGIASPAAVADVEAIYTNIAGHPTAQVPDASGEEFRSPLAPFLALYGSPDGAYWIFKAFTDNADSGLNDVIVAGSGTTGAVVAREADAAPLDGLTYGFMDSDCGVNDSGWYAFGNRLSGGSTTTDEIVFAYDGNDIVTAAREGNAAPNLFDPGGSGDELFGNSLNSVHVLGDGTVAYKADLIQNIATDYESALYQGTTVVAQEGTTIAASAGADVYDSFTGLSGDTFSSSADGSHWIVEADVAAGVSSVEAVVVDGSIVVRDGDDLGLGSPVDAVFAVDMAGNGDWFARGDLVNNDVWAIRNGAVVASSGGSISTAEGPETWVVLLSINGNSAGNMVIAGETSTGDDVAVVDLATVVFRSGDAVDLGTGPAPAAFIGGIHANDVFIADSGDVYAFVDIVDDVSQDLGDALIRWTAAGTPCPWDCDGSDDGIVGVDDFLAVLAQWTMTGTSCDLGEGAVGVGVDEFLAILAHWGSCP